MVSWHELFFVHSSDDSDGVIRFEAIFRFNSILDGYISNAHSGSAYRASTYQKVSSTILGWLLLSCQHERMIANPYTHGAHLRYKCHVKLLLVVTGWRERWESRKNLIRDFSPVGRSRRNNLSRQSKRRWLRRPRNTYIVHRISRSSVSKNLVWVVINVKLSHLTQIHISKFAVASTAWRNMGVWYACTFANESSRANFFVSTWRRELLDERKTARLDRYARAPANAYEC